MATISAEGENFFIDAKRTRIISGTLHPARIPQPLWPHRILAARQAGLNTIEVPALWAAIEQRPGNFDFTHQNDLAGFCTIAADLGLRCILRAGPYIGDAYPLGGLPAWLLSNLTGAPRSNDPSFIAPVARYFSALGDHLANLQITGRGARSGSGGGGGGRGRSKTRVAPIILIQIEHEWLCPQEQAGEYISELARLLREAGFTVPIISRNLLFNNADTILDTWAGYANLYASVRQLRHIAPDTPAFVTGLRAGAENQWGQPKRSRKSPNSLLRAIAETIAAGGHLNIAPFHRGTTPADFAGALPHAPHAFATTGGDTDAPLTEAGARGPAYHAARLICTFARSFERLLTDKILHDTPISIAPDAIAPALTDDDTGTPRKAPPTDAAAISIITRHTTLGSVVFLFNNEQHNPKSARTSILLPDGSSLPVYLGARSVCWVLARAHLFGRATLDYTNLTPFILEGQSLVLVGPAGTPGLVSINNAPLQVTVPTTRHPIVEFHEGVNLIIANEDQAATIYAAPDAIYAGVQALTADHQPILADAPALRIHHDATTETITPPKPAEPKTPKINSIAVAPADDHTSGNSARYASIPAPDTLNALGADTGYGWMRMTLNNTPVKSDMTLFQCADRALVFSDARLVGVIGDTPGAQGHTLSIPPAKGGARTITFLLDNMGRPSAGTSLIAPKGLFASPAHAKKLAVPAPKLEHADIFDPLTLFTPIMNVEAGEVTHPQRITFKVTHRRATPLAIQIDAFSDRAIIFANGSAIGWHEQAGNGRVVLPPDLLKRGVNIIQFAVLEDPRTALAELKKAVSFYDLDPAPYEKASWAFARWEQPAPGAFTQLPKADTTAPKLARYKGTPTWWRVTFDTPDNTRPLFLNANALTKGRLYLNHHDIGRYFVATHTGKSVPPQARYYLPECWLHTDKPNELLIFDEHGHAPNKITFTHNEF